jgi:TRAP-type C4-dicarboxylate transport system substrate-binding protein
MSRVLRAAVLVATLALLATSCGASDAPATIKAGGAAAPQVLTMGTDDWPGRPAADQVEEFARRVESLSDGELRIEPVWRAGDHEPEWDQRVARKVVSGELDLGNVPTRAWDTEGVTSLRALNAPFLVTSDELLDAVVVSEVAEDMLAGLDQVGVVGLALLPESLRHPFGFAAPLLGPDDYAGGVIRAPHSATAQAMFAAFGADTTDAEQDPATQLGMESQFGLDVQGTATGNVTFYPKVESMVINAEVFDGLSERHRQVLVEAATSTRDWVIDTRTSDLETATAFCEEGGAIVLASDEELAALQDAVAPVYDELEADEQTRAQIEAIRALGHTVAASAAEPAPCGEPAAVAGSGEADTDAEDAAAKDHSAINGIYRWEFTREELEAAALPDGNVDGNTGVWTNWFQDGRWWDQEMPMGIYELDGDLLKISFADGKSFEQMESAVRAQPDTYGWEVYRWEHNEQGDLLVTIVDVDPDWLGYNELLTARPWLRVGDIE